MKFDQKNHFAFDRGSDRNVIMGRVLTYLHKRLRGQIFYEQDLTTFASMHILIEAFNNTMKEGERVKAYFLNGDKACGVEIALGEVRSIPMNSYYQRYVGKNGVDYENDIQYYDAEDDY
jgi:predicted nucleic acid-binding protein